jgi:hypothetical protein
LDLVEHGQRVREIGEIGVRRQRAVAQIILALRS